MAQKAKPKTRGTVQAKAGLKKPPARVGKTAKASTDSRSTGVPNAVMASESYGHPSKLDPRQEGLYHMLMAKRQEIMKEIQQDLGHSLTTDQQRRLESGLDAGDQALMDLDRELGISLLEMRNRRRQMIDEALIRLEEGNYGVCPDCGVEISERRLAAVPFAKLCVECQSQQELLEKIEREEDRD